MSEDKVRLQAFYLLEDIIQNKKYSNLTLKKALEPFEKRDKAFISAIVYGTLDKLINIDYVISLYAKGKIHSKVRNILRMGIYQIMYMDKVPDSAAVSTSVDIANKIGKGMLKGYVNGVLRNVSRNKNIISYPENKIEYLAYKYSFPIFFVKELIDNMGIDGCEKFLSCEDEHKITVRVDKNKGDVETIKKSLSGADSLYFEDCFYITGEPQMLENGICSVQSESSMAAVKALAPEKGDTVLDCCAAPGGKTVYIASLIKEGKIVALDKHEHRVELIRNNAKRCGYSHIIEARQCDMTNDSDLGCFDKVLVDAPCSGMGVLGQKPEIKNTITPEGFCELQRIQKQILKNASLHVKKGGILVYSTCTVRKQENEDIITEFLKNNDFELCSLSGLFSESFEHNRDMNKGYIQLYPHIDKTEGFFIARMRKI